MTSVLDRTWMLLIVSGIIFFIAVLAWDFFQFSSGNNSEFSFVLVPVKNTQLLSESLETHLQNGDDYFSFSYVSLEAEED